MEQINEAVEQRIPTGGKRLKKSSKKPLAIAGGVIAAAAAAYIGLCTYAGSLDTFYPNRQINGIDVGGLTVEAAQEKLESQLLAQPIEITNHTLDTQQTITVADLGYTAEDFQGDAAFWMETTQKEPGFLAKGWEFLSHVAGQSPGGANWPEMDQAALANTAASMSESFSAAPIDSAYQLSENAVLITCAKDGRSVTQEVMRAALADIATYSQNGYQVEVIWETVPAAVLTAQEIYDQVAGEMKNAGYDKETNSITPEQIGAEFDVKAAQAALDAATPGETVSIPAQIQRPAVTAEKLAGVLFRDVLGEYTTSVSGTDARRSNVKRAAASINNYVMNTSDVFSYNEALGQRTAANGYLPAPAYVRGETVDEIGGGICQTSSTLYLACLRGNLEITERYAHRYIPSYVPAGMDATVSWGGPDYKFTNQTDYPIKIVATYENHKLTVRILGTNVDGTYGRMTNEQLSTTAWETVYEVDETKAPGSADTVKTTPYTGSKWRTYHTIYDKNGNVLDRHYEATSDYKVRNKVILQAPAPTPVPAPVLPATGPVDIPVTEDLPPVAETPAVPAEPAVGPIPPVAEEPAAPAEEVFTPILMETLPEEDI